MASVRKLSTGEEVFESDAMQCEFTKIEVSRAVVTCFYTIRVGLSLYCKFPFPPGIFPLGNVLKKLIEKNSKLWVNFIFNVNIVIANTLTIK